MNRAERQVLAPLIKRVRQFNSHAWWELKRQTWDAGFQHYYPRQDEFLAPALRALASLDSAAASTLAAEYARHWESSAATSLDEVKSHYAHVIVGEVVNRARAAAYRTSEW